MVITAVQIAYDLEHVRRPVWRRTVLSVAFTVGGIIGGAFLLPLLVVGPGLGEAIAGEIIKQPDLRLVRSVGWTDLMVGHGSKGCTRVDWIEVRGRAVPEKG